MSDTDSNATISSALDLEFVDADEMTKGDKRQPQAAAQAGAAQAGAAQAAAGAAAAAAVVANVAPPVDGAGVPIDNDESRLYREELGKLVKKRGVKQARVTRFINGQCRKLLKEEVVKVTELIEAQKNLDNLFDDFKVAHDELMDFSEEDNAGDEEERFETIFENKSNAAVALGDRIDQIKAEKSSSTTENFSKAVVAMEGATRHRLPDTRMPTFNGSDVLLFPEYWRDFVALVDCRKDLNDTTKMTYLRQSLQGSALASVSSLANNDAGYKEAKKKLITRYGLKRYQVNTTIRRLAYYKPASNSPKEWRATYDYILNLTNNIADHGLNTASKDVANVLIPLLETKFGPGIIKAWEKHVQMGQKKLNESANDDNEEPEEFNPTLDDFFAFLDDYLMAEEASGLLIQASKAESGASDSAKKDNGKSTGAALTTKGQSGKGQGKSQGKGQQQKQKPPAQQPPPDGGAAAAQSKSCAYCGEAHWGYECPKIQSASKEERWEMVTGKHACFTCLCPGHQTARCFQKQLKCDLCKGTHHRLLHDPKKDD